MTDDELQDRTCRCCGRNYKYPVLKSQATRFHCESCISLSGDVRDMFERFNKRIGRLTAEIERLKRTADSEDGGS